jgi:Helix-turn-helix.
MNKWKLKEQIEKAGFTQFSLAKELGMSKNTLNGKINGHVCFDTEQIGRICDLLHITDNSLKAEIFLS